MARVYRQKTRKERECGRCRKKIEKGEEYLSFSPGFRSRPQIRCTNCYPRQSELTTSKLSGVYAALEEAEDAMDSDGFNLEDAQSVLDTAAEAIRAVAEEYREASQAWASGQNEEFEQKADEVEQVADDLEQFDFDEPEYDPDDSNFDNEDEWRETQLEQLRDHVSGVSVP